MASRVKAPEPRHRSRALGWLTALPPFAFASLTVLGCPPHEARLSITTDGIQTLTTACRPCGRGPDGGIDPTCACAINLRPPPEIETGIQARLFLVTPSDQTVRDASKCMTLNPCADGGHPANCLADSLNQQLDGAIPRGLGFDGLENPDDVLLMLAFYDPVDPVSTAQCVRGDLIACAGLRPPLGGGNYDISCASCQGGPRNAPGPDNGPCPKPKTACFLTECDAILEKNAY